VSTNDDQQFLNEALQRATESDDPQAEIGLILLRYHQAMLNTIQHIRPCGPCTTKIDLGQLQTTAREIQQDNYANYQELQHIVMARLSAIERLCSQCQGNFRELLLSTFIQFYAQESP
jgi:hypothetical protein